MLNKNYFCVYLFGVRTFSVEATFKIENVFYYQSTIIRAVAYPNWIRLFKMTNQLFVPFYHIDYGSENPLA